MIAYSLRNSVLQSAVQGRLTNQFSSDGNAADLYTDIKKQIHELTKLGKTRKKTKQLSPVGDEEAPFDIPDNWKWVRLGDISYNHGQTVPLHDFSYIDVSAIDNINNCLGTLSTIQAEYAPSRARKIVNKGDVIYSTVRPYLHNICVIDREIIPSPIASTAFAVICTPYETLNQYLFYTFLSPMFDQYVNSSKNSKGVAYPAINDSNFYNSLIPLPPLAEQTRIINRLNLLFPRIELLVRDAAMLHELQQQFPTQIKHSILNHAIQGKLTIQSPEDGNAKHLVDFTRNDRIKRQTKGKKTTLFNTSTILEDEIPFEIPDNWCWARIGEIVDQNIGGGTPDKSIPEYWNGNIPWASVKDLNCVHLTHTLDHISQSGLNYSSSNLIPKGNIIICTRMGIGKIVFNDIDVAINQDLRALFLSNIVDQKYFYYYYQTLAFDGKGATVKGITLPELNNTLIPLPPMEEQVRIVRKLEEILLLIDSLI